MQPRNPGRLVNPITGKPTRQARPSRDAERHIGNERSFPVEPLSGGSDQAAAAFCQLRVLVRRCEGWRYHFLRGDDLPIGSFDWSWMPPDIDTVRRNIEDVRPAIVVGSRGLQSKTRRIS